MPFGSSSSLSPQVVGPTAASRLVREELDRPMPDFWTGTLPVGWVLENTVGSLVDRWKYSFSGDPPDPNFNPFDPDKIKGTVFEHTPGRLLNVHNQKDWDIALAHTEEEYKRLQIIEDSDYNAAGALLLMGILDPVNLLPVGIGSFQMTVNLLRSGFKVAGGRIAKGASAGAVGNLYAEAILYNNQELRSIEQSAMNVSAGTLFGAMVGTVAAVPAVLQHRMIRDLHQQLGLPLKFTRKIPRTGRSRMDDPNTPLTTQQIGFARNGEIVDPNRPIKALDDDFATGTREQLLENRRRANLRNPLREPTPEDPQAGTLTNWVWTISGDFARTRNRSRPSKPHTTTMLRFSELARLLGRLPSVRATFEDGFSLPRVRLYVTRVKGDSPHASSSLKIVAVDGMESLAHVKSISHLADPDMPVEIVVVKPTKAQTLKMQMGIGRMSNFDRTKLKRAHLGNRIPENVSLGRLESHISAAEPTAYQLTRSITCNSPCRVLTNEDILAQGDVIPGGLHEDGTIGISQDALEADVTGAYNPEVRQTNSEIESALGLETLLGAFFPAVRLATNPLLAIRQVTQKLIDTTLRYQNHALGIPGNRSAESGIRRWYTVLGKTIEMQNAIFIEYRIANGRVPSNAPQNWTMFRIDVGDRMRGAPDGVLTKHQFYEEVGRTMRRQLDGAPGHDNPFVARAAAETRKMHGLIFEAAERVGLMDPIIRVDASGRATTQVFSESGRATADSHFRRVYNKHLLANPEERARFIQAVTDDWMEYYRIGDEADDQVAVMRNHFTQAAERAYDNIMSTPSSRTPEGEIPGITEIFKDVEIDLNRRPGSTRPRTLDVPDTVIERWLEDDVQLVTRYLFRTMVPDIEIARNFGKDVIDENGVARWVGDPNMSAALADLEMRKEQGIAARRARGDTEESIEEFARMVDKGIKDLANLRDLLRGQYAVPSNPEHSAYQFLQSMRAVNYITMGGGFTVSSIPDVSRLVTVNGLEQVARTALQLWQLPRGTRLAAIRELGKEARLAGVGWETLLNQRAMNVFDLSDDYSRMSKIQLGLRAAADRFAMISLLSPWNDMMKRWSAIFTGQSMAHAIMDWSEGRATVAQRERLAFWGFNARILRKMTREIERAERRGDLIMIDTPNWRDREARDAYKLALGREVDRTIITPMAGDVPLTLNTELGRTVFQFKRFAFAATKQILLMNAQFRDMQSLNGMLLATALGMMVAEFKAAQYDYQIHDPMELFLAALDRSGQWGMIPDFNNSLGMLSRGTLAPGQLIFGGHNRFKYSERDATDVLLGPTRGTIRQASKVGGAFMKLLRGEPDQVMETEIRAAARLSTPYTLFYFTNMIDKGVKEAAKPGARVRRQKREEERKRTSQENAALLRKGDYTFAEMGWEDGGVDEMFDFLRERDRFLHNRPFALSRAQQRALRSRFNSSHLSGLKQASDEGGITGMLAYLRKMVEDVA